MNEQKRPPEIAWADSDGGMLWALAPRNVPPTRSAAYVRTSEDGIYLTAAQCRGAAAHLTALADYHEETMSRSAQGLPTEPGVVIVPADGHEYITATFAGEVYRAREAILRVPDHWHAAWRSDTSVMTYAKAEWIDLGTWKVGNR